MSAQAWVGSGIATTTPSRARCSTNSAMSSAALSGASWSTSRILAIASLDDWSSTRSFHIWAPVLFISQQ